MTPGSSLEYALTTQMQKRIAVEKERAINTLVGGACGDFSEYRYAVGYIKCLDDMATIAGEIVEDINKG